MTAASFQASAIEVQAARTTYMIADASYYIFFKQIEDILVANVMNSKYVFMTYQKLHVDYLVI